MSNTKHNIHVIGAGVSGLVAAKVLEEKGFSPIIFEATGRVGGRVKTDIVEGYQLDRGFQVLLTAYPAIQKYIHMDALDLQYFKPGAVLFDRNKKVTIGDPLRDITLLFPTLFSGIGTMTDKLKMFRLQTALKCKTLTEIFQEEEVSTQTYLEKVGFSKEIIQQFFRPFFAGIFLEPHLTTSSRMFEFVYKMFGEGYASLPKSGIEAIPKQLFQNLERTEIRYNTKVKRVKNGELILENGDCIESDYVIVATDAGSLIPNLSGESRKWQSCDTLYFETNSRAIDKPLIGLLTDSELLINNIFFHTSLKMATKQAGQLLSVTVVKTHGLSEEALVLRVQKELKECCGIEMSRFLKRYAIPKALPSLNNLQYEVAPSETQLTGGVFLAGDTQLNGSLNAAMIAGERAALGVLEKIGGMR
jgi:phytoene dehydrogenase-like protein